VSKGVCLAALIVVVVACLLRSSPEDASRIERDIFFFISLAASADDAASLAVFFHMSSAFCSVVDCGGRRECVTVFGDGAAIKLRGKEAGINFSIQDYEDDLKQIGLVPDIGGRVLSSSDDDQPKNRLYVSGWSRSGQTRIIATNIYAAEETIKRSSEIAMEASKRIEHEIWALERTEGFLFVLCLFLDWLTKEKT
ncbi:hypothetical protein M8C21_011770, partial [Ambrosia artemisiifolia]